MGERVFMLPDLGEGLEEAVVSEWLVAEGDEVALNQPFVEIETAKATVEVPAPFAGRIATLHAVAGATIAVGAPLVTFEVEGVGSATATATPAVRKHAKDLGVDLTAVEGTGPEGRVTREDVERASSAGGDFDVVPISLVRATIARNLEAIAAIPQVTTFRTLDASALVSLRTELGVSPLPVFVRALAEVCAEHRVLNASWSDDGIRLHRLVDVGIATDTERGLVVPVVRDAGGLGITTIAGEIGRLADRARSNALTADEVSNATIAVSNTGSYGSEFGTPLLNPGHAVTIALGVIEPRALVVHGRVEALPACTLSLTFDHRVLDGATVGRAFGALVDLFESPERLGALPR
ncbi:MAG TPA: dihydrolipoamide acetyltransferase family protein [Actinomycetota bacterium]|nr:dihydrolipoamide acetyltransferase family protein [Actinomycetota bacterium]